MNFKLMIAATIVAGVALGATLWLGGSASKPVKQTTANKNVLAPPPKPVESGPRPKATVDNTEFHFGAMAVYETRSHVFTIKNTGEAPLKLTQGETTCKCTLSELKQGEVLPGESADVELEWHPIEAIPNFLQTAKIHTNDPYNATLRLTVTGRVESRFVVEPHEALNVGDIFDDVDAHASGVIRSTALDSFKIESITCSIPQLKATAEPLPPEELAETHSKSGYRIKATLEPGVPIGQLFENIDLQTDIDGGTKVRMKVKGFRPGPIKVVAAGQGSGGVWNAGEMRVQLSSFLGSEGKKVGLNFYVKDAEAANFKFEGAESDEDFLKVTTQDADQKLEGGTRVYLVQFEVPPGTPPLSHTRENPAIVTLKTNLPGAEEIKINVEFISQ